MAPPLATRAPTAMALGSSLRPPPSMRRGAPFLPRGPGVTAAARGGSQVPAGGGLARRGHVGVRTWGDEWHGGRSGSVGPAPLRSTQGTMGQIEDPEWWEVGLPPNCVEICGAVELAGELARAEDRLVVVDFYRPDCHACKAMHRALCKLAEVNPEVVFLKVQYQLHCELCAAIDVDVLPMFHLYRGAQGRVSAFTASLATIKRLKGAVAKFSHPMCSRGRRGGMRAVEGRTGNAKPMTTKERLAMKKAMKAALEGRGHGIPCLPSTAWVRDLDAHLQEAAEAAEGGSSEPSGEPAVAA